jgi:hypothetical protein
MRGSHRGSGPSGPGAASPAAPLEPRGRRGPPFRRRRRRPRCAHRGIGDSGRAPEGGAPGPTRSW